MPAYRRPETIREYYPGRPKLLTYAVRLAIRQNAREYAEKKERERPLQEVPVIIIPKKEGK